MKAPLGYFDANASGLIRGRLDAAAVALLTRRNTPAYGFYRKNGFEGVKWRAWMVRPCSPEA